MYASHAASLKARSTLPPPAGPQTSTELRRSNGNCCSA